MTDLSKSASPSEPRRVNFNDLEPNSPQEELVYEICRELYDRFMMGGWEPHDAHDWLRQTLQAAEPRPDDTRRDIYGQRLSLIRNCYGDFFDAEFVARAEPRRDEREQFESYSAKHAVNPWWLERDENDEYRSSMVEAEWRAWQAARSSAAPLKQTGKDSCDACGYGYHAGCTKGDCRCAYCHNLASLPQPSLPQENADSLNTNSVAGDGLKTTPSAGQPEGK